ncbi:MAG TPA: formylglycine-generating enzyme family protein, partial [Terriglobia bacterium]|nr:formylglycine-generating enzyme family protein [Terriglobia bacterium]
MLKLRFVVLAVVWAVGLSRLRAQDSKYSPQGEQIPGPPVAAEHDHCCARADQPGPAAPAVDAWRSDVRHWRDERRIRIGYDGSQYTRPELAWTQSSFIQPQMMIEERYFYDPAAGRYTVDRYLDDLERRYGGIDSVLIWHTYPNLGIDNRNQYDLLRDMPGGVAGLRQMIADFHRRGVRVLFPLMLWDQGTRDAGLPNQEATAALMTEIGADGINGDTLDGIPRAFRDASDRTGHAIALEPEGGPPDEALAWNNLTWGYWSYPFVPMISKYKWLEPRHMVNVCDRWARDKTDNLQYAFFNGVGYESWENIWGIWNPITPRDAEALRRVAKIERMWAGLLISPDWEPHTPTLRYGVFASKYPPPGGQAGPATILWTIVNRNEYDVRGRQIEVPYQPGDRYYDLWHGVELTPAIKGSAATLSFDLEAHGYGALLQTGKQGPAANEARRLEEMRQLSATPLAAFSHEWRFLPQQLVETPATPRAPTAPDGMVRIPGATFRFQVSGIEIEGGNDVGVDQQCPWEDSPRRHHDHVMA